MDPTPTSNTGDLSSQVFLVVFALYCLVFVVVIIFLMFFLNRFMAFVVTQMVNWYVWRTQRASFELDSLRFSILSGCIVFKRLEYVTQDYILRIEGGIISFRYWLPRVKPPKSDDYSHSSPPSRFALDLAGVEWFVFNHTTYWHRLAKLQRRRGEAGAGTNAPPRAPSRSSRDEPLRARTPQREIPLTQLNGNSRVSVDSDESGDESTTITSEGGEADLAGGKRVVPWYLPVDIEVNKGAILVGNHALETLLCLTFRVGVGVYAALDAPSELDIYQSVANLEFTDFRVRLLPNFDFQEEARFKPYAFQRQPPEGDTQSDEARSESLGQAKEWKAAKHLRSFLSDLKLNFAELDILDPNKGWKGLGRYDTRENIYEEYGRVESVIEAKTFRFRYVVDVEGVVPEDSDGRRSADTDPTWDASLEFVSTTVTYGPWADRQRFLLQNFFYPFDYVELPVGKETPPGRLRPFTLFVLRVQFSKDTTWRLPMREASKDHLFDGPRGGPTWAFRKYAWMDLKFSSGSFLYKLPMVCTPSGYTPTLTLIFNELAISTSLNYATFATASLLQVDLRMRSPRLWSQAQDWNYLITLASPRIFFLRDHVNLFFDLVDDLTTAPPMPHAFFVPSTYTYIFRLTDLKLFLNVNEGNIIGQADNLEDNTYMVLNIPEGSIVVGTAFLSYQPSFSTVSLSIDGKNPVLTMSLPRSHTVGAFLQDNTSVECVSADDVSVSGQYTYFQLVSPENVDSLSMRVDIKKLKLVAFGYFLHHVLYLKENYFGIKINFTTLEEFRAARNEESGDLIAASPRSKLSTPGEPTSGSPASDILGDRLKNLRRSGQGDTSPLMAPAPLSSTSSPPPVTSGSPTSLPSSTTVPASSPPPAGSSSTSPPGGLLPSTTPGSGRTRSSPEIQLPKSNIFEFHLFLFVADATALLPTEMFSADNSMMIHCASLELDVRYLPIFVDLALGISPLTLCSPEAARMCEAASLSGGGGGGGAGSRPRKIGSRRSAADLVVGYHPRHMSSDGQSPSNTMNPSPKRPRFRRGSSKADSLPKRPSSADAARRHRFSLADARLVIEGFSLTVHMMFGPAPAELTYHNSIRVNVGPVAGNLTPVDVDSLLNFGNVFPFQVKNVDNRLQSYTETEAIPDYLEAEVIVESLRVGLINGLDFQRREPGLETLGSSSVAVAALDRGLRLTFSTLWTPQQTAKLAVLLPSVTLAIFLPFRADFDPQAYWASYEPDRHRSSHSDEPDPAERQWAEVGRVDVALDVVIVLRKPHSAAEALRQKEFLRHEDSETLRIRHLYEDPAVLAAEEEEEIAPVPFHQLKRRQGSALKLGVSREHLLSDLGRQSSSGVLKSLDDISVSSSQLSGGSRSGSTGGGARDVSSPFTLTSSTTSPNLAAVEERIAEAFSPIAQRRAGGTSPTVAPNPAVAPVLPPPPARSALRKKSREKIPRAVSKEKEIAQPTEDDPTSAAEDSDNESFYTASDRSQSILSFEMGEEEEKDEEGKEEEGEQADSEKEDDESEEEDNESEVEEPAEKDEGSEEEDESDEPADTESVDGGAKAPLRSRVKRQLLHPYLGVRSIPRYQSHLNRVSVRIPVASVCARRLFNPPMVIDSAAPASVGQIDTSEEHPPALTKLTVLEYGKSEGAFVRVQSRGPVNIFVTPLIYQFCEEAVDAAGSRDNSINSLLDSLQASYVKGITLLLPTQLDGTHFELAMEKVTLHGIQEIVSPLPNQIAESRSSVLLFEKTRSRLTCIDLTVTGLDLSYSNAILKVVTRPERRFPLLPHVRLDEISEVAVETSVAGAVQAVSLVVRYAKETSLSLSSVSRQGSTGLREDLLPPSQSGNPPLISLPSDRIQGERVFGDRISTYDVPVIAQLYLGPVKGAFVLEKPSEGEQHSLYTFAEGAVLNRESTLLPPPVHQHLRMSASVSSVDVALLDQFFEVCMGVVSTWELFSVALSRTLDPFVILPVLQRRVLVSELAKLSSQMRERKNAPSISAPSRPSIAHSGGPRAVGGVRAPLFGGQGDDPLFLTKPSNIWRLGRRPHQNDDGWKLLAHLRHCHQQAPPERVEEITAKLAIIRQHAFQKVLEPASAQTAPGIYRLFDPDNLFKDVLDNLWNWRHWERDELTNSPLLTSLYDQPTSATGLLLNSFISSSAEAFGSVGQIGFTLLNPSGRENRVTLLPVQVRGQSSVTRAEAAPVSLKVTRQTVVAKAVCQAEGLSLDITSDMVQTSEHVLRGISTYIAAKAAFASEKNRALESSTVKRAGGISSIPLKTPPKPDQRASYIAHDHSPPSPTSADRPAGNHAGESSGHSRSDLEASHSGSLDPDHLRGVSFDSRARGHQRVGSSEGVVTRGTHPMNGGKTSLSSEGEDEEEGYTSHDDSDPENYVPPTHAKKRQMGTGIRLIRKQKSKGKLFQGPAAPTPQPISRVGSSAFHSLVFKSAPKNDEYRAIHRHPPDEDDLNDMELGLLKPPSEARRPESFHGSTGGIAGGNSKTSITTGGGGAAGTGGAEPPVVGSAILESSHRFEYDYDVHFVGKLDHITATFDIHNLLLEVKLTDLSTSLSQQPPPPPPPPPPPAVAAGTLFHAAPRDPTLEPTLPFSPLSAEAMSRAGRTFSEGAEPQVTHSTAATLSLSLSPSPPPSASPAPHMHSASAPTLGIAKGAMHGAHHPDLQRRASLPDPHSHLHPGHGMVHEVTRSRILQSILGSVGGIWVDLQGRQLDAEGNVQDQRSLLSVDVGPISLLESQERKEVGLTWEPVVRVTSTCDAIAVSCNSPLLRLYEQMEQLQDNPSMRRQLRNIVAEVELTKNFMETGDSRPSASQVAKTHQPQPARVSGPVRLPRRITFQTYLRELTVDVLVLPTLKASLALSRPSIEITRHRVSSAPDDPTAVVFETDYSLSLNRQSFSFFLVRHQASGKELPGTDVRLTKFSIPTVRMVGSLRPVPGMRLTSLVTLSATVEQFDVRLNDQVLDTLLQAQVSLGNEVSDFIQAIKTRVTTAAPKAEKGGVSGPTPATSQATAAVTPAPAPAAGEPTLHFRVDFVFKGIRLQLVAPVAVITLESGVMKAKVRSLPPDMQAQQLQPPISWNCVVTGITLALDERALAPDTLQSRAGSASSTRPPSRDAVRALGSSTVVTNSPARLASVIIDLSLQNYPPKSDKFTQFASRLGITRESFLGLKESFFVNLYKAHGVLQSVAADLITDVFLFHQKKVREFTAKQKELAHASVRARTKTLIKTVNRNLKRKIEAAEVQGSFLEQRLIFVHLSNLAAAIPMVERVTSTPRSQGTSPVFLVSASDIIFSSKKGEASAVEMISLSLKFVDDFDAQNPSHFRGETHPVMNCGILPSIFCQVYVKTGPTLPGPAPGAEGTGETATSATSTVAEKPADRTRISVEGRISGIEVDTDIRVASHIMDFSELVLMNKSRMTKLLTTAFQQEAEVAPSTPSQRSRTSSTSTTSSTITSRSRSSSSQVVAELGEDAGEGDRDGTDSPGSSEFDDDDDQLRGSASDAESEGGAESLASSTALVPSSTNLQETELELFADMEILPGRLNFYPESSLARLRHPPGASLTQTAYEQMVIPSVTVRARHLSSMGFVGSGGDKKSHAEILLHPSTTSLFPPMTKYVENMAQHLNARSSLIPSNFYERLDAVFPTVPPPPATRQGSSGKDPTSKDPTAAAAAAAAAQTDAFPLLRDLTSKGSRELTLSVRLSQTTVQLNCAPLAKVVASLDVSQADLLFSFKSPLRDPEATRDVVGPLQSYISLTLSLPLARVRINHAYSIGEQGDCLHSELRGLALSASLMDAPGKLGSRRAARASRRSGQGRGAACPSPTSLISGVLDIRKAIFNFNVRQYHDYAAFRRIWLNIPEIRPAPGPDHAPPAAEQEEHVPAAEPEPWLARRDVSIRLVVHVQDVSLLTDLGQAIGKASVVFQGLNVVLAKGVSPPFVLMRSQGSAEQMLGVTVSLASLVTNLEGRFEGLILFEGVQFEAVAKDPWLVQLGEGVGGLFSMNETSFYLMRAKVDLKHNLQKILKLSIDSILLVVKDVWTVPAELLRHHPRAHSESPAWEINLELVFRGIDAKISKETLPSLLRLQERFAGLLSSKQGLGAGLDSALLSRGGPEKEKEKEKEKEGPLPAEAADHRVVYKPAEVLGFKIFPRARLDVRGANMVLSFFKYNLHDLDAALVSMDSFLLELTTQHIPARTVPKNKATVAVRAREEAVAVQQELTIQIGETKVQKATFATSYKKDEIVSDLQSTRDVFVLPSCIFVMETWQVHNEPLVFYKFMSDFDGTVDVTLNVGLYQYLKDLGVLYSRALAPPGPQQPHAPDVNVTPVTPSATPLARVSSPPSAKNGGGLSADSGPPETPSATASPATGVRPTSPKKEDEEVEEEARYRTGNFEFQPLNPLQLEPQLKALGDATPPLEKVLGWMGVDKKMIPTWTHAYLSANVEKGLIILQENLTVHGSHPETQ